METSLEVTYDDKQCWMSIKAKNQPGLQANILNSFDLTEIPVDCIMQMGEDPDGLIDLFAVHFQRQLEESWTPAYKFGPN